MNKQFFEKKKENVRKRRDVKGVKTEARMNYSVSEPNYNKTHTKYSKKY